MLLDDEPVDGAARSRVCFFPVEENANGFDDVDSCQLRSACGLYLAARIRDTAVDAEVLTLGAGGVGRLGGKGIAGENLALEKEGDADAVADD